MPRPIEKSAARCGRGGAGDALTFLGEQLALSPLARRHVTGASDHPWLAPVGRVAGVTRGQS